MNVLITSAGRRDYLVEYFREALADGRVLAADASESASALGAADEGFVLPAFTSGDYAPALLHLVRTQHVGLLLTVNDLEALVLAPLGDVLRAEGCLSMVPSLAVVRTTMDKVALARHCRRAGIASPHTHMSATDARRAVARDKLRFPLVVKPRSGSASIGMYVVHGPEELEAAVVLSAAVGPADAAGPRSAPSGVLVQERLRGPEYGIDVVNDADGHYVTTLMRRKLAMRSGETDKAVTVYEPRLEHLGRQLSSSLGHRGCLDCDVIVQDGTPYLIDANPRFGGGYPFMHEAGSDVPGAYVAWAEGRTPAPECFTYRTGVVGAKSSRVIAARHELERLA